MKKIISCLVLCAMLLAVIPISVSAAVTADTSWYDETSTTFTLKDAGDLMGFHSKLAAGVDFSGATVNLVASSTYDMQNTAWDGRNCVFKGIFNGNGATIKNFKASGYTNSGMFQAAIGEIKNFTIDTASIGSGSTVGILIGGAAPNNVALTGDLTVSNIHVLNGSVKGGYRVGGLIGGTTFTTGKITMENCSYSGTVTSTGSSGSSQTGGIIGYISGASGVDIKNCAAAVTVSGTGTYTGGVTGYVRTATLVEKCSVDADVSATGNGIGGVAGYVDGAKITVKNSIIDAYVHGTGGHKGIVGGRSNNATEITDCLLRGSVEHGNAISTGGSLIGWLNTDSAHVDATNCIIDVELTNINTVLGLYSNSGTTTATLSNIYYNSNVTTLNSTATVTGAETAVAKDVTALSAEDMSGWTNWTLTNRYPVPTASVAASCYGYQVRDNGDGTSDYRIVATLECGDKTIDDIASVGFYATLTLGDSVQRIKVPCTSVYRSVIGGGITYSVGTGTDTDTQKWIRGDYLFMFIIDDIPSELVIETDFNVDIITYVTTGEGDTLEYTYGAPATLVAPNN